MISRRTLLSTTFSALGAAAISRAGGKSNLRIGVTDWNLQQTAKLDSIPLAKRLGFEGVQVSLGIQPVDGKLLLADPELQARFVAASTAEGITIDSTCLDVLHRNYLKSDKLGQKWVADSIGITKALRSNVILLPFFGKGALTTRAEMDYVGDVLRELAPEAQRAGVVFGLENTISAEDNVRIMDRAHSPAVQVYYDIGNSTSAGFDINREIAWLGASRICQFHFKDNPHYLGEGTIQLGPVLRAIQRIGYVGYANLETDSPSKSVADDMRRNLGYVRRLMEEPSRS